MTDDQIQFWLDHVRDCNPYPNDIFTPPTEEEIKRAANVLSAAGIVPDRIFAWWGRKVWNNCLNDMYCFLLPDKEIDKRNI